MLNNNSQLINSNIYLNKIPSARAINFGIFFNVGSFNDSLNPGISHLLEHIIFEKVQRMNDKKIKAIINAYTTREYTLFTFICNKYNFNECVVSFLNTIFNMEFDDQIINHQKNLVIKEMKLNNKEHLVKSYIINNFYSNISTHPICGDEVSVQGITKEDIIHHYESYYIKNKFVISINGNFNIVKTSDYVGNVINTINNNSFNTNLERETKVNNGTGICFKGFDMEVVKLNNKSGVYRRLWLMPDLSNAKERILFSLILTLLSGGIGSDLYNSFQKDKALSYYINSYYFSVLKDNFFAIEVQTAETNYHFVKDTISKIINKRIVKGIKKIELDNLKYLYWIMYTKNSENTFYLMEEAGRRLLFNNELNENEIEILKNISVNDFNRFFIKCFDKKNFIEFF